jgi:type VI secretion system protein ImpI
MKYVPHAYMSLALALAVILIVSGCSRATPSPTPVPTPTPLPTETPIPTPTPVPTATPVPLADWVAEGDAALARSDFAAAEAAYKRATTADAGYAPA